ncbi:MAG: pirin family protein [Pseudomonadales bacterium]
MQTQIRELQQRIPAQATTDGDGVNISRVAPPLKAGLLDPFLLLDEIVSDDAADYIGGFPPHPHRGFETVTYMIDGAFSHKDHLGNEGRLVAGGVQWMTAGKGVIHSEMPEQDEGRLHGFQLWINLPAAEKMSPPQYREIHPAQIPVITTTHGVVAKVIAGQLILDGQSVTGPVTEVTSQPDYIDLYLPADSTIEIPVDPDKKVLLMVFEGELKVGDKDSLLKQQEMGILGEGNSLQLKTGQSSARLLLLAGRPLKEPIANWGPFVMNTAEEIEKAIQDYRDGRLTD